MTTLQKATIGMVLAVVAGAGIYEANQASGLRERNRQLAGEQQQLAEERDAALADAASKSNELSAVQKDTQELLRLRGEIGALRNKAAELERVREQNRSLARELAQAKQSDADPDQDPQTQTAMAKLNDGKLLVLGLLMYANEHQDQYPANFEQSTNYIANGPNSLTGTNEFELVIGGALRSVKEPMTTIALREKTPWLRNGKRVKAYAFADGHAELRVEPPEGFDAWEQQHIVPPPNSP